MRISSPNPEPRKTGDYRVDPTAGYGTPYADIWLDEKGELRLRWVNADDCERLIRAATAAKEQILRYAAQMTAPHGRRHLYQGTCQLCGKPEDDALHAEPVITESCGVEIQAIRDDGDDCWVCTEDDGHAGDHIAKDIYDREVHRWPAEPVITDSGRDCDQANPPHHYALPAESACDARDGGYVCNAQDGHDGPDHVAYGSDDQECHRWPMAAHPDNAPEAGQ